MESWGHLNVLANEILLLKLSLSFVLGYILQIEVELLQSLFRKLMLPPSHFALPTIFPRTFLVILFLLLFKIFIKFRGLRNKVDQVLIIGLNICSMKLVWFLYKRV